MIRYPTKRRVDVQDHILEEWPGVRRFAELLDQTCRESKARFEKLNPKTVETKSMKQSVKAKCESCGGTGLYQGMCEGKGRAVVCLSCKGTGCVTITYEPFEGRKRKRGVQYIKFSRGTFLATGVGGIGDDMSYVEFEKTIPDPSKS